MSVKKAREFEAPVPADLCYEVLRKIGSDLKWKVLEEDPGNLVLKWRKMDLMAKGVRIGVTLTQLPSKNTHITLTGEIPGMVAFDGPGNIPKAWKQLLGPFESFVAAAHKVQEGLICPTCGKSLPKGTRFCPNDGTEIAIECNQCGSTNAPSAQFCTSCGASLE